LAEFDAGSRKYMLPFGHHDVFQTLVEWVLS